MRLRNVGKFNRRIIVQDYKEGFNEQGDWVKEDWVDFTKAMAYVKVKHIKNVTDNDVQYHEGYTEMFIRQNKFTMQISTGMRVKQRMSGVDIFYTIEDIDYQPENNEFITLKCKKE